MRTEIESYQIKDEEILIQLIDRKLTINKENFELFLLENNKLDVIEDTMINGDSFHQELTLSIEEYYDNVQYHDKVFKEDINEFIDQNLL